MKTADMLEKELADAFDVEMSDPHRAELVQELRSDRSFQVEYARTAFELASNVAAKDEDRAVGFAKLRTVAPSCGGMAEVAKRSEIKREQLYRILSGKSNPTMDTLAAVLHAMGLRLTVAEETDGQAQRPRRTLAKQRERMAVAD